MGIRYIDVPFPVSYANPYAVRVGDEEICIPEGVRLAENWEGGRKFLAMEELPWFVEEIFSADVRHFFIPLIIRAHCRPGGKTIW